MFQHLLIPLDGSPRAEEALPYAKALAERFGSHITLLHVVGPITWEAEMRAELPDAETQLQQREAESAAAYLRQQEAELAGQGFTVNALTLSHASVPAAILATVAGEGADAIVMCTHGLTGLRRLLLGSVAEQVVRRSPVPVVLVRSQREEESS